MPDETGPFTGPQLSPERDGGRPLVAVTRVYQRPLDDYVVVALVRNEAGVMEEKRFTGYITQLPDPNGNIIPHFKINGMMGRDAGGNETKVNLVAALVLTRAVALPNPLPAGTTTEAAIGQSFTQLLDPPPQPLDTLHEVIALTERRARNMQPPVDLTAYDRERLDETPAPPAVTIPSSGRNPWRGEEPPPIPPAVEDGQVTVPPGLPLPPPGPRRR